MNFFEMIYHSGPDEFECDFYKNNNDESRRHFFDRMLNDATHELDNLKLENDVDDFLLSIYQEQIDALNHMKDEFIKNGKARFNCYVSLCVAEKTLKDV
ncbi:hypothetical protein KW868_02620 [Acinetobacter guillouiae]|uniref:Uncharacterized protein n=1 Tax=Acinetobacter guillouiae TaxID=106649 RepID=A0A8X8GB33_ACIGI|nr:hypothetical protein [Acinetobacter guillouiae]MCF0263369.1 hypothetical protein [Acinetobacter guillouiae]